MKYILIITALLLASCESKAPSGAVSLGTGVSKFEDKENGVVCYRSWVYGGDAISCVKVK